ncbi:MAG: hypothetical protein KAH06_00010 [Desulfobacterales bacterium]|nr:hypothetical protein [Desulfobacterales bacterium]
MLLILLILLLFFSLTNFYYSIQILRRVSAAEIKISFFEIRWQVHKHMKKYRQLTRAETGHTGLSWYGYWLSLALMIICGCWLLVSLSASVSGTK